MHTKDGKDQKNGFGEEKVFVTQDPVAVAKYFIYAHFKCALYLMSWEVLRTGFVSCVVALELFGVPKIVFTVLLVSIQH